MALRQCRECSQEVSTEAVSCPNCGAPDPTGSGVSSQSNEPDDDGSSGNDVGKGCLGCFGLIVAFFFLMAVIGSLSDDSGSDNTGTSASDGTVEAWTMCEEFVKDRLSAPSTADFPWDYDSYLESHVGQEYTFDAYVDAENKLGGTVRTEFTCTVRNVGGGEWRLVDLNMRSR